MLDGVGEGEQIMGERLNKTGKVNDSCKTSGCEERGILQKTQKKLVWGEKDSADTHRAFFLHVSRSGMSLWNW